MGHVRLVLTGDGDERTARHINRREEILDNIHSEVTTFFEEVIIRRLRRLVVSERR